jgi:site-specific recombinase XerD
METAVSVASKPALKKHIITGQLNHEILDAIYDYSLTSRVSESTKELYLQRLRTFGLWLMKQGIKRFPSAEKGHINCFLATYDKNNTKNGYITALRPFYGDFLNRSDLVGGMKYYAEELELITPSDVLTSNEVVTIAEKAGERREMYKVIILSLFESCARVNELLSRLVSLLDKELFYCFHPSK